MNKAILKLIPAILIIFILPSLISAAENANLEERAVTRQKPAKVVADGTLEYLQSFAHDPLKIWVFFTDKGVNGDDEFDAATQKISINRHAVKRRHNVGIDNPVYADLPVDGDYIAQIEKTGAKLRRESRWLNAASFEITENIINTIARLPFVYKVKPVAKFYRDDDITDADFDADDNSRHNSFEKSTSDALDYGPSQDQLDMINVPVMHNMGYNGQGVVVAMLDTGFRKSHEAFALSYFQGRVLDEYDFINNDNNVQNELGDSPTQHNHGTYIWSSLGGYKEGSLIGPAYGAMFLLAKTEDVDSETTVEEDNWVVAMEWADSLGAQVISSSLAYSEWYEYSDYDGNTATITQAANIATGLGIVVCNAIGNYGPGAGTLAAPADAFDIISVGAVNVHGDIAGFSSRGPTADGRIKPEVCALGESTICALGESDAFYGQKSGTSLSTPLVGGAATVLLQARPSFTPQQVRQALMETADRSDNPGNTYGWGVIDLAAAAAWGADFSADTTFGFENLTVSFSDQSPIPANSWKWYFGDGDSSDMQNPIHTYSSPGLYDVTLKTQTSDGELTKVKGSLINIVADTIWTISDSLYPGESGAVSIYMTNTQDLKEITVPISYAGDYNITINSIERGARTDYFTTFMPTGEMPTLKKFAIRMVSDPDDILPMLAPGSGEIAKINFTVDSFALSGQAVPFDTATIPLLPLKVKNPEVSYPTAFRTGVITIRHMLRGDADFNGVIDLLDILFLIDFKFKGEEAPQYIQLGDANADLSIDLLDILYLIDYKFKGGPAPLQP